MMQYKNNKDFLLLSLLLILTFVVFIPAIRCGLTNWDDPKSIIENNHIRSLSFDSIREMFGSIYFSNYQPVANLSYAIEYYFFGLNPFVFHLTNLLIHLINVFLVFYFIKLISKKSNVALLTAALFAIHPLRVESVVWATERKDVLYAFFFLMALINYVKYLNSDFQFRYYILALFLFLFSCMSKGMGISLSPVLFLVDYLLVRKFNSRLFTEKIPFFMISIAFGLVSAFAIRVEENIHVENFYTFYERIQFAGYAFLWYFYKLIAPFHLSSYYPFSDYRSGSLPLYYWLFPLFSVMITVLVVYASVKFSRKLLFAFGFFTITVFVVLQLWPYGIVLVADRYSYVSSIGLFYLAGEMYHYGIHNKRYGWLKYVFPLFAIALICFFSIITYQRIAVWKNSITLWNSVIEEYPHEFRAYFLRGNARYSDKDMTGAIADYEKAIQLNPNYYDLYNNLGNAKRKMAKFDEALLNYDSSIRLKPTYSGAYCNRGAVKFDLQNYDSALKDFDKAIELDSSNAQAYLNRANVMAVMNKYAEAIDNINKTIHYNPYLSEAYLMRANLNALQKNYEMAIEDYNKTIVLDAANSEAYFNRGVSQLYLKNYGVACEDWKKALDLGNANSAVMIQKYCSSSQ